MSGLLLGILASSLPSGGDYESIATVTVGSGGASSIEFTSIPGTYQHLQVRGVGRYTQTGTGASGLTVQFNADTASNYAWHVLFGNGTSASAGSSSSTSSASISNIPNAGETANAFGAFVADVLDYSSTSKTTTIRSFGGYEGNTGNTNSLVVIRSGLWTSTAAVTSIALIPGVGFAQHSTVALYGLRAP